ncbi:hypothetical protein [Nodularia spumigena]|nr:hypothetical protein [Nodularia spumigena]MDB9321563.1 hypothetical protein [Nodularia spumigena CS-591/07A]MDB9332865.1 hypothetical protein [Nodularia spumigena CS-591/04]MDB9361473.1 hypothetical protein [Nodularia spumigena CS-588/02]MDB9365712.1 hypothetical protein [Nodularia spumigena CS-588/02A10]MDB9318496.1 hypothetical protein [Nodularia spumigena CS-590/01A]
MSILQQGFACKLFLLGEAFCIFGEILLYGRDLKVRSLVISDD